MAQAKDAWEQARCAPAGMVGSAMVGIDELLETTVVCAAFEGSSRARVDVWHEIPVRDLGYGRVLNTPPCFVLDGLCCGRSGGLRQPADFQYWHGNCFVCLCARQALDWRGVMDTGIDARQIEHVLGQLARLRHGREQKDTDALENLRPTWLGMDAWEVILEDLEAQHYRVRPRVARLQLVR